MKTTRELEHQIRSCKNPCILSGPDFDSPELAGFLQHLLKERHLSVGEVIQRCNLDRGYGYQLFNGIRRPTRNMLLILAFQLQLGEKQTQRMLKLAGRPALYARNRRDAALLYGLNNRLTLAETEELLGGLEVDGLGSEI